MFFGYHRVQHKISGNAPSGATPILISTLEDSDKALENHVILTRTVSDVSLCACSCFANNNCASFNFEYLAQGKKSCELNNSTKELSEASFVKRIGFLYYG